MDRPSSEILRRPASRSNSTVRSFLPEGPMSQTSNFMAGGPVVGDGLLASNGKVETNFGLKRTGRNTSPTVLLARARRRLQRHRRRDPSLHPRMKRLQRKGNDEAIRRATWCVYRREEFRLREDAAEESSVGLDARYGVLLEGATQASDRFFATVSPGDQLAQERIVVHGHGPAFVDAFIETNPGTAGRMARKNFSGRREKIIVGIFGVETDFHGVTARGDGLPGKGKPMAGGNGDLQFN